ncbi:MAG: GNAT family N-acetyltransferase [Dehalococcoidia bacterium]
MTVAASAPTLRMIPIHEADLGVVAPLVNRAFGIYSDLFKGVRTSPGDYRDEAGDEARVILVEQDGRLVATSMIALAERFTEPDQLGPSGTTRPAAPPVAATAHPWSGALYYGLAGVEPEIMNRGLGRMMVNYVETVARTEGFPSVALGTVREFGLVDYYEKLSYRVTDEHLYPAGHWDFVVPHHHCEMIKVL